MMVPVIAGAVHDGVEPGVGEAVLRVTGLDTERTAQVMLPTASAHSTRTGSGTSCQDIQYTRSAIYNDHIVLNSKHGVTVYELYTIAVHLVSTDYFTRTKLPVYSARSTF